MNTLHAAAGRVGAPSRPTHAARSASAPYHPSRFTAGGHRSTVNATRHGACGWEMAIFWIGVLCWITPAWAAEEDALRLVPFPKEVRLQAGRFSLARPLVLEVAGRPDAVLERLLNEELKRAGMGVVGVRPVGSPMPMFRLAPDRGALNPPAPPSNPAPGAYALRVDPSEVVCSAREDAGLFYGLQTLCHLIRANRTEATIPCLTISDWPTLRWRCFQDDMTRGPSSTLDTLQFEAALGAYFKLNLMTFYMEYQYAFRNHPKIGPPNGSLTPEDLSALVQFAKPLQLDILGNQQSFGHFGRILEHPEYAALRETPDILTPVRDASYQLLDDLFAEVCPLLPFPWFNVCCDETYGLGTGPARELTEKIGVGGVYVRHIRRVHDLLRDKYGKRMMMWGDIILQHPGHLAEVPKDTIMLTWGYDARPSFEDQIVPFAKSGFEFFVCPGVNNWSRILPDFGVAVTNIQHFVRDGVKHGALGMINTDWEDDGEAINAVKWHADAWAAECAWNGSATSLEAFNRRIGAVLFGEPGDHFGQAVTLLTQTHRLPGMNGMFNARFWENDFAPKASPATIRSNASNLLAVVRPAREHLAACRQATRCNERVLAAYEFGARRMELIGQRMLDGLAAAQLYEQACEHADQVGELLVQVEGLIRRNGDAHAALGREFAALWHSESKPYALDWTLSRYTNAVSQYATLLEKVGAARTALAAGQPLPAPGEIGLAIPAPLARCVPPRERLPTPLAPELPWAEVGASSRLGVSVRAGAVDRFALPVEVELALPEPLAAGPVRAFLLVTNETPRELLAQLDPAGQPGKQHLSLVMFGLPKGVEALVHVYLGAKQPPPALAGAARTTPAGEGRHWLENDRIRLLLGPEGAHIYRWEVKSAGNRDVTMPGETGWAGFSDIGTRRQASYRLNCTAHGPALVEYECTDDSGHSKRIRLLGGASWVEVFLNEPAALYWDFDDPKNFAADGPTPGTWLFSNGQTGPVGREADGVPAQVKQPGTYWGMKYNSERLALGLITPEVAALHLVAPGAGAGGVGIENSPPAQHFVTFAGLIEETPADTMNRLHTTLDLQRPVEVRVYALQAR